MGFAQRLKKLENALGRLPPPLSKELQKERTDEEEADILGAGFLWPQDEQQADYYKSDDSPLGTAMCAWHAAAAAARRQGHTEYHLGLRPFAMAVWLLSKAETLQHRATHGYWIWDEPPTRADTMPRDEYEQLDLGEKIRLEFEALRRRGHWSKDKSYG
jgi:hypothetical protein